MVGAKSLVGLVSTLTTADSARGSSPYRESENPSTSLPLDRHRSIGWSDGDTDVIKATAARVVKTAHTIAEILSPTDDE